MTRRPIPWHTLYAAAQAHIATPHTTRPCPTCANYVTALRTTAEEPTR